jgi:membrane-associated phospholipid phosphatase
MLNNYPKSLYNYLVISSISLMSLTVMLSRYYLGCHTIQQIILGGLIGLFTGYYGYKLYVYLYKYLF